MKPQHIILRIGSQDRDGPRVTLTLVDQSYIGSFYIGETMFVIDAILEGEAPAREPTEIPGMQVRPQDRVLWNGNHYLVTIFPADP